MERIIEFVHNKLRKKISKSDCCVDMTLGNGHDTLFLSLISKFVYGFDIQNKAIENTSKLLKENNCNNFELILSSHDMIDKYINIKIKGFIFNLGYLPSGDKSITTTYETTIKALIKCLDLLDENGIIALVIYTGHEQGKIENEKIMEFVKKLPQKKYDVVSYKFENQINNPPYALLIERK